jgi:Ca2+:H+ antiporter
VHDGRSNWFEGVMLTAVYVIIAIGFFFVGE